MSNYETLVQILDQVRKEAPAQYGSYYPLDTDVEKLNQARAKALVHLYLKVKFGLLDFVGREQYVTDGIDDGGIDAYYVDTEAKKYTLYNRSSERMLPTSSRRRSSCRISSRWTSAGF